MEEDGTVSYWAVLFKANNFSDLLDRLDMIEEIAAADKRRLQELSEAAEAVVDAQNQLIAEKDEIELTKQELDATQTQLEEKQAFAQEKAKSVEKVLLDKYMQVKKHSVPPVARLYGDQCGGCNMSLPQVTLRKFKADVLYIECENCGRMIIQ